MENQIGNTLTSSPSSPKASKSNLDSALHLRLNHLAETPTGFAVAEITGFSPEQVRRAAQALVKAGRMVRCKISSRRIRYFKDEHMSQKYMDGAVAVRKTPPAGGLNAKAKWSADIPPRITPRTKIYIAPPQPRDVFRTNTYQQF